MLKYKKSRFVVTVVVLTANEKMIAVYQTLTRAFALLLESAWLSLLDDNLDNTDEETRELLARQGILVKEDANETALFELWFKQYVHDFNYLRSKVVVSRICNLDCLYCIIGSGADVMSAERAQAMDAFYLEQIACHEPKKVTDIFSGGEPLLNLDIIAESASRRYHFCQGKGVEYGFSVITNGTLLNPDVVNRLQNFGLATIRVSMAGTADVHDRLRTFTNGSGTYGRIVDNLASVSGTVPLAIECQYDAGADDFKRIPEMLDDLIQREIHIEGIEFTPILARRQENHFNAGMGTPNQLQFLQDEASKRGLSPRRDAPSNACQADYRAFYVFDTDGSIIPCPSLQCGEMAYGHVSTGIDFVAESQMRTRRLPEQCREYCELLPLCTGGCRLMALTRGDGFNGIDCNYEMYGRLLEDWIKAKAIATVVEHNNAA